MDEADALEKIADEMAAILSRFKRTREGIWIADGDEARFTGLVLEARDLLAQSILGPANDFWFKVENARFQGALNFTGSQSYHSVEQAAGIVRSAVIAIRRRSARPSGLPPGVSAPPPYVNLTRIEQLRSAQSPTWDLQRLLRMCEELNSVFAAGHALASAMLLRAIVDHVPPIFGVENFGQVIASIDGQSPKKLMERLHTSSRDISNRWLHQQIRKSESLPTTTQVDFRQELDALLGEVVGKLR
jgi:hypothetical protein